MDNCDALYIRFANVTINFFINNLYKYNYTIFNKPMVI